MRVATIGEDGSIRDADGIPSRSPSRRPMVTNRNRRGRGLSFLASHGTGSFGQIPETAPDKVGMAYLVAIKAATPASKFTISRKESDPSSYIYPGRLIVSGDPSFTVQCKNFDGSPAACGTVFRFSARPTESGQVMLVALEGKAVGSYITISEEELLNGTLPDGTPKFYVVDSENVNAVEVNITQPRPFEDGKFVTEQATGVFSNQLFQQAYFGLYTIPLAFSASSFTTTWEGAKLNIIAAMALAQNGLDRSGMAYDFSAIGRKSFNIYIRVGSDILLRAIELLDMLDSIVGTADDRKVVEFYDRVAKVRDLTLYWAAMLERASLFSINTSLVMTLIAINAQDMADSFSVHTLDGIRKNREQVIAAMVGKDEGGGQIVTPERAVQLYEHSVKVLESSVNLNAQGIVQVDALVDDLMGGEASRNSIPEFIGIYSTMLRANASNVIEIREQLRQQSIETPEGLDSMGAAVFSASALAAIAPTPGNTAKTARQLEIINALKAKAYQQIRSGSIKKGLNTIAKFVRGLSKPYEAIGKIDKVATAKGYKEFIAERSILEDQVKLAKTPGDEKNLSEKLKNLSPETATLFKRASEETVESLVSASKRIEYTKDMTAEKAIEILETELPKVAEVLDDGLKYLDLQTGQKTKLSLILLKNEPKLGTVVDTGDIKAGIALPLLKKFADSYIEGGYLDHRIVSDLLRRDLKEGGVDPLEFAKTLDERVSTRKSDINKGDVKKRPSNPKDPSSEDKDIVSWKALSALIKGDGIEKVAQRAAAAADNDNVIKTQEILPDDKQAPTDIEDLGLIKGTIEHVNLLAAPRDGTTKSTGGSLVELLARIEENPADAAVFADSENAKILDTAKIAMSELKKALADFKASIGKIDNLKNLQETHPKKLTVARLVKKLYDAAQAAETAAIPVRNLLRGRSWRRILKQAAALRDAVWGKIATANKWRQETIQKSIVGRIIYSVVGLPFILTSIAQPFWWAAVTVFGGSYTFASSPLGIVWGIYGFAGGLLSENEYVDPGVSDPGGEPSRRGAKNSGLSPVTKVILFGLGVALISSGGKVFGAIEKVIIGVTRIFEGAIKLVVPPKKKGARGRPPAEGGPKRGPGRPRKDEFVQDPKVKGSAFMRGVNWR